MNFSQHHQHQSTTPSTQETRILTTFPTEGLPEPRVEELRRDEVLYPPSTSGEFPFHLRIPLLTQLNRWFCCQCATRAIQSFHNNGHKGLDKIGMVNSKAFDRCHDPTCSHIQCANCALGPGFGGLLLSNSLLPPGGRGGAHTQGPTIVRTVAGLHAHPFHIDPCHWECACREWMRNVFDNRCTMHLTRCANPRCQFRNRRDVGVLRPDSVVLNRYGQRLGTADQRVVEKNGPWMVQRHGLSMLPVWKPGYPAPRYKSRPPPPPPPPLDKPDDIAAYLSGYLANIPRGSPEPMFMPSSARADLSRPGLMMMSGRSDGDSRGPMLGGGFNQPPRPGHPSGHPQLPVGVTAAMPSSSTRPVGFSGAGDGHGRIGNGWQRM